MQITTLNTTEDAIILTIEALVAREKSLPIDDPSLNSQLQEIESRIQMLTEVFAIGRGVISTAFGFNLQKLNSAIEDIRFN